MSETVRMKPYEGDEPYIFVSFAAGDLGKVEPILRRMFVLGYRMWYDDEHAQGTENDTNIADCIRHCSCLMAFTSCGYSASDSIYDLCFARSLKKNTLLVHLEETDLPLSMDMRVGNLEDIFRYKCETNEEFYRELRSVHMIRCCLGEPPKPEEPEKFSGEPAAAGMPAGAAEEEKSPGIMVVGVGGAGSNIVSRMANLHLDGVDLLAMNSDAESLSRAVPSRKFLLNINRRGEWTPENIHRVCGEAVELQSAGIRWELRNADIVFLTCGMGGFTGTGAVAAVANLCRDWGIPTVALVSMPFRFEGSARMKVAEAGLTWLKESVDLLVVLYNDRLLSIVDRGTTMQEALSLSDETLIQGVQGIADLIARPGIVRLNFDDLCEAIRGRGLAYLGAGLGEGPDRIKEAAGKAAGNPMLETRLSDAGTVLVNITAAEGLTVDEISEATALISAAASPNAGIVVGTAIDESLGGRIRVIIIAAGLK